MLCLAFHRFHHGQFSVRSGTDDGPVAVPRNPLFFREGRMTEGIAKLSGRLLLAPQSLCAIDDNIVLTGDPADLDGAEGEVLKLHRRPQS